MVAFCSNVMPDAPSKKCFTHFASVDLWPTSRERSGARSNIIYTYVDENGKPLHRTIRTPEKRFWQEHSRAARGSGVRTSSGALSRRRTHCETNETVCICEGEKDVDRLRSLGYLATCNPMGAGKWLQCYADSWPTATSSCSMTTMKLRRSASVKRMRPI